MRKRVLDYVRDDGLAWVPPGHYMEGGVHAGAKPEGEIASTWATAKIIRSLSETYARTGDKAAIDKARQMFLGLAKLADWKQGRAIYEGDLAAGVMASGSRCSSRSLRSSSSCATGK